MTEHSCFVAEPNQAGVPEEGERIAIIYDPPPKANPDGTTSYSIRFATLIVSEFIPEPDKFAKAVADVLSENAERFRSS